MENSSSLVMFIIGLLIIVALFVLLREAILWYWKVNTIVENQRKNNYLLKKMLERSGHEFSKEEIDWLKSK